jgi:ribosomal-protein-alanine N-acetyltransferase
LEAIERIECGRFSNPWHRDYFAAELENSSANFFVAEREGGEVVGYILFWKLGGELELHKVAVATDRQRQGHGARLMEFFISRGRAWGCERAILEVRATNAAAVNLYEKYGFRPLGRRKEYYTNPVEDALVFELKF